jgi:hypothetical protein
MKLYIPRSTHTLMCIAAFAISACSGNDTQAPVASDVTISGTVAGGAAYPVGTSVFAYDKNNLQVGTTTVGANGFYSITLPPNVTAPIVLKAEGVDLETYYSFSPTLVTGTVNVTKITNLIAARLSPTGVPADLKGNDITASNATQKTQELMTVLSPVTAALLDATNPVTGDFKPDGTGHDRLLDTLNIKLTPTTAADGTKGSNIDVTVVAQQAPGENPIVIPTFTGTQATVPPLQQTPVGGGTPIAVTAIPSGTSFVVPGTSAKVTALVERMQVCYAIPIAQRVKSTTVGTVVTYGTQATDIIAPECKGLFFNNDASTYKNNGFVVSSTGNWSGIFSNSATGAKFDSAQYAFTRSNGDIVLNFRSQSATGTNLQYNNAVAKLTLDGTELRIIGNQYDYDAAIEPLAVLRTYVNDPSYDFKATGYRIYIENKQSGGNPIFSKAVVTAPNGKTFTLKPTSGYSYLALEDSTGFLTGSSWVLLNAKTIDAQAPVSYAMLSSTEPNAALWSDPASWTDAKISEIPQQGVWKFDYFLATNTTSTPDITEYRRTQQRASTVSELLSREFADFTATQKTETKAGTPASVNYQYTFSAPGQVNISSNGNLDAWAVPMGAIAPNKLTVFGRAPYVNANNVGNRFSDTATFSTSTRKAIIPCSRQGNLDLHCDTVNPLNFATGARYSYIQLNASGPYSMNVATGLATYVH